VRRSELGCPLPPARSAARRSSSARSFAAGRLARLRRRRTSLRQDRLQIGAVAMPVAIVWMSAVPDALPRLPPGGTIGSLQ
jgi:hypothetical protein